MDYRNIAYEVFNVESDSILNLKNNLTDDFNKVIKLILSIKGRLIVSGMGKSGHIGSKIAATLASTGTPSLFLHPAEALHGDLGMITKSDVVLVISNSGESEEVLRIIPSIKHREIPIIAMSGNKNSTLARESQYLLDISIKKEACPLQLAPTSSTAATLAMGDAISVALMNARGFKSEDFAMFHPGGSLGRKLLTKVRDIMHVNDLPIVSSKTNFKDLIECMTSGKLGVCLVCDNGSLSGIITDGDLRRALRNGNFECMARDIMTNAPKTIDENSKVSEAEEIMLKYKIKELVVLDNDNNAVGIVQLYDIGNI